MGACRLKSKPYLQPGFSFPLSSLLTQITIVMHGNNCSRLISSQAFLFHSPLSSRKSPSSFTTTTAHSDAPSSFTAKHSSWQSTLPHPLVSPHEKSPSSFTSSSTNFVSFSRQAALFPPLSRLSWQKLSKQNVAFFQLFFFFYFSCIFLATQ